VPEADITTSQLRTFNGSLKPCCVATSLGYGGVWRDDALFVADLDDDDDEHDIELEEMDKRNG